MKIQTGAKSSFISVIPLVIIYRIGATLEKIFRSDSTIVATAMKDL